MPWSQSLVQACQAVPQFRNAEDSATSEDSADELDAKTDLLTTKHGTTHGYIDRRMLCPSRSATVMAKRIYIRCTVML